MTATVGMLSAPITSIYPNMESSILLNSFIVVIVGGIGSILGVFVASMIFGIIDNFSKIIEFSFFGYEILPAFSSILIYLVMLTVLIFRPMESLISSKKKTIFFSSRLFVISPIFLQVFYIQFITKIFIYIIFAYGLFLLVNLTD